MKCLFLAAMSVVAAVVARGGIAAGGVEPGTGSFAIPNRAPLESGALKRLPVGAVAARGWLQKELELMRDGMAGHLEEISPWCNPEGNAWLSPIGEGKNGWEELPYWLRGYGDLGLVLKDEKIAAGARRWLEAIMASQEEDGYFGPRENKNKHDVWPNMLVLDALGSYYEATGDARVPPFMTRYFKWEMSLPDAELLPGSWQKVRGGDNLASVLWLYNRTGEARLLDLARRIHERTVRWDKGIADWHGVNICQGFREPGVYWQVSHDKADLAQVEKNYQEVMGLYGQVPGGMFGADEICRKGKGDPRQAAETCSMVEFMRSAEIMLGLSGNSLWADRCEDVAFNSLPAALTADMKALHYLTAPNMALCDRASKAPGFFNGGNMLAFDPFDHRCCQHNHAIGWPYYVEHMWMATAGNGLCAALYGPCEVDARVGGGEGVGAHVTETTDYPFRDAVEFRIGLEKGAEFALDFRVPGWCRGALVFVNSAPVTTAQAPGLSGFQRIKRTWADGDNVRVEFPMTVRVQRWDNNKNAISVSRGPLTYSLKIGEEYRRYGPDPKWPAYEVHPMTAWNYALLMDESPESAFQFEWVPGPMPDRPFDSEKVPVRLRAKARRVPAWQLDSTGLVEPLQMSPAKSDEPEEAVTLIPMGAARLRIAAFPRLSNQPGAHEWVLPGPARHGASFYNNDIEAVSDGVAPGSSSDDTVARFTWWDHVGTAEWITWNFDAEKTVPSCEVYWYDDTGKGKCRVPASWRVLYNDGTAWREVANAKGAGVERDRFNRVTFDPVKAKGLKIEVRLRDGYSGGILEWRVGP